MEIFSSSNTELIGSYCHFLINFSKITQTKYWLDVLFIRKGSSSWRLMIFMQNICNCLLGITGWRQGSFYLIVGTFDIFTRNVVICQSRNVEILSFQSGSCHPQIKSNAISQPRKDIARIYISKETKFSLRHCEHWILCCDSEWCHTCKSISSTHNYTIPIGYLQTFKFCNFIVSRELLSKESKSIFNFCIFNK